MNTDELNNRLIRIEQSIQALNIKVETVALEMLKYATQGQLKTSEATTKNLINATSQDVTTIIQKLNTIVIPADTRYYLSSSEIELRSFAIKKTFNCSTMFFISLPIPLPRPAIRLGIDST